TQTPAGTRSARARQPGLSEGMVSPATWVVSEAASRSMPAASMTLKRAQPSVAPVSLFIAATKASPLADTASAAFRRSARRAFGPVFDQAGKAAAAASQAAFTSA